MNASNSLINDLEKNSEQRDKPKVGAQLAGHRDSRDMENVHRTLLCFLVGRESSKHHKNDVAACENAQERDIDHKREWSLPR